MSETTTAEPRKGGKTAAAANSDAIREKIGGPAADWGYAKPRGRVRFKRINDQVFIYDEATDTFSAQPHSQFSENYYSVPAHYKE